MRRLAPLACLALAACNGSSGTVSVTLTTAPGSHVLDAVQTLRMTLTDPRQVVEATRGASGFDLVLDFDAGTGAGALIVEGLDVSGTLIACGESPPFPVDAITAHVAVYMAAPMSIALSPAALDAARSDVAGALLPFGVVLAGGRDSAGAASTSSLIYNAYDHSFQVGMPLPAARAGLAAAPGLNGGVYLFGGEDATGTATGTLWRFDTTVSSGGSYATLADGAFARTNALLVPVGAGTDQYLVTGAPALTLASGALTARTDIAALPAAGAAAATADGMPTAIFAGSTLIRFRQGVFDTLSSDPLDGAAATQLPDGRVAVVGGALGHDALIVDGESGQVSRVTNALATARTQPSIAATSRHLVVAGGTDSTGQPIATAEVLDAAQLQPVATLAILPRIRTVVAALPDDQVLIAGGTPASDQIELFTPPPP